MPILQPLLLYLTMFNLLYKHLKSAYYCEFDLLDFLEDYVSIKSKARLGDESYYENENFRITLSAGDILVCEKVEEFVIQRYSTVQGIKVQFTLGSWILDI